MKPIFFNTEMVRAILNGRKTVTRRVVGEDARGTWNAVNDCRNSEYGASVPCYLGREISVDDTSRNIMYPKYDVGDILYVRETWQYLAPWSKDESHVEWDKGQYYYAADGTPKITMTDGDGFRQENFTWRPSIHMPKEAARIFLRVTGVRVERLQDITEADVIAEGTKDGDKYIEKLPPSGDADVDISIANWHIACFEQLWNSTLKEKQSGPLSPYRFCFNPWVWVYEFERCGKPE